MKGTRLWQRVHSPLIEGRSRRERSLFVEWFIATALSTAGLMVVAIFLGTSRGASGLGLAASVVLPLLAGSALGAVAGVWLARGMGWRPTWLTGLVLAVPCGAAAWGIFYSVAFHR